MGVNRSFTQNIFGFGFGFWVGYKYFQVLGLGIYIRPKPQNPIFLCINVWVLRILNIC